MVIAEVKSRSETSRGPAAEAVGPAKRRRIILAAQRFLQQSGLSEHPVRFDVVEVTPAEGGLLVHSHPKAPSNFKKGAGKDRSDKSHAVHYSTRDA